MPDIETERARQVLLASATFSIVMMFITPALVGFRFDLASFSPLLVLIGIVSSVIPYTIWRKMRALQVAIEASMLGLLMNLPVLVLSYAAMRASMPLADQALIQVDRAIGFDWPALVAVVDRSPSLSMTLGYGYSSIALQLFFLPMLLAVSGQQPRAYQMGIGYILLCTGAIAISVFFPAQGAYVGYGVDGRSLSNINAHFGYFFLDSFNAVRNDPDFTLAAGNAAGILTFPSVHAAVALLCAWAAWDSRWLRPPFLALNVLMAISALTHGAHYLVDVIAGLAVAAAAIRITLHLTRPAAAVRSGRPLDAPVGA